MSDKVVILGCTTSHDIPPRRVLESALQADLETVIVIGRDKDGFLYRAGSEADGAHVLWDLEQARLALLGASFNE